MTSKLTKHDYEQLSEFRYQLRIFMRYSEEVCRSHELTPLQYLLLLHLKGTSGRAWATVGELAERLQAQHHGVVVLISRCEKLGWVSRQPGRSDRRQVEVSLTEAGEKLLEVVADGHRDELLHLHGKLVIPDPTTFDSADTAIDS